MCLGGGGSGGGGRVARRRRRETDKPKLLIKRKSMKLNLNSQRGGVGGDFSGSMGYRMTQPFVPRGICRMPNPYKSYNDKCLP